MISGPVFAAKTDYVAPAFFFENFGGVDSGSRFIMESPGFKAIFRNDGVVYRSGAVETTLRFSGADPHVVIEPIERISGTVNFLIGADASHWKTGVPVYRGLRYRSLYRGIDVVYHVADDRVKADFVVAPGADAGQIRLQYPNARLRIERNGDLVVAGASDLRENAPFIYQETRAGIVAIEGRYRLEDEHTATFEIGEYDASLPLIIDPVITYATFCGGSTIGSVAGVAADTSGNVYVAGWTEALNFPISGAIQASNRGGVDAFVAKLNPAGTALVYATYIGGNGDDRAAAIAVDGSGQAYITGSTSSTNFPLTAQIRSTLGGGRDGFAVKLNAAGSAYVYSTYLGGSAWDQGTSIAVDSTGAAYIAGDTQSSDFPVLSAVQSALGGQIDAFVTKLGASGAISFSTFLGGSSNEHAGGIAIDSSRNVYIAGGTYSSNFPVANAFQRTLAGGQDAFVAKIASTGSSIAYSTYLGGSGGGQSMPEQVNAIAVDGSGAAYVAGVTGSVNFPTTSGVLRTTGTGFGDAFVAKLSSAGNALSYSTYLGGTTSNAVTGIAVDSSGNAYAVGFTSSVDFPQTGALQTFGGAYDAFIAELNPGATALVYSTYYGGSGSDIANAIAIDANSSLYVAGQTSSADFPVVSGYQNAYPGMATGWVLRVAGTAAALPATPTLASPGNGASGVSSAPALSWSAATGATSYDIYLGTSTSPAYVANVSGTTYGASGLGSGQTYYWQVAARN